MRSCPDWAAARLFKMEGESVQYTPSSEYSDHTSIFEDRIKKREENHHLLTLIAVSIDQIMSVLSDYRSVEFVRAYSYNEIMMAVDVIVTLNKKQAISVSGPLVAEKFKTDTWPHLKEHYAYFQDKDWENMRDAKASGFVYAQTYTTSSDLVSGISEGMAIPLSINAYGINWQRNVTSETDTGWYEGPNVWNHGKCNMQLWRSAFVATTALTPYAGLGKAKFAFKLMPQAMTLERMTERLHAACAHPDFEYATTNSIDGEMPFPPTGYFWRENLTATGSHREVLACKEGYVGPQVHYNTWRRLKQRPVPDTDFCWFEPGVQYKFLTKKQFGEMFGPMLPAGMSGMDFQSGYLASISWVGSVKISVRGRDGQSGALHEVSKEFEWNDDIAMPFRPNDILAGIRNFRNRLVDKPDAETHTQGK